MGQSLIHQVPSQRQVNDEMNDLLQTVYDCHVNIDSNLLNDDVTVLAKMSTDLNVPANRLIARDDILRQLVEASTADASFLATVSLPQNHTLSPVLFDALGPKCEHCKRRLSNMSLENKLPASVSLFLPTRCNHAICSACLPANHSVDAYYEGRLQCRMFICSNCGLASEYLLRFEHEAIIPVSWTAKLTSFTSTYCFKHRHAYENFPSASFTRISPRRLNFESWPSDDQTLAELDFTLNRWVEAATRHYLNVIGKDGEELAKLNVVLYLRAISAHLKDVSDRLKTSMLGRPSSSSNADLNNPAVIVNSDDECQICFEAVGERGYGLLDCCSHRYCEYCVKQLIKGTSTLCPTCLRPFKKIVFNGHFYPSATEQKVALFENVKCIDELIPSPPFE